MKFIPLSKKEKTFISSNYLIVPVKTMVRQLGRSSKTIVYNYMRNNNLIIPQDIIEKRKSESMFSSGHTPINKGIKQSEYMSPEAIERTKASRLKKGTVPHNTKVDFAITVRKDNRGVPQKFIRISPKKWLHLSVFNWKKEHGTIPLNMIVSFINGDTMNCEVSNLKLISKEENMLRNTIQRFPKDVQEVIRLSGKLKRVITKKNTQNGER